uniref:Molybdate transport system ATP-binding protein n=1 Tax=Candidatus Kentrum sp. DK TaxID=2126562 RepID=A0A450SBL5_9GAMM|nr:MAG: molybdate transport system ATP-binding protein [Candidatus Kentron sp. DK]
MRENNTIRFRFLLERKNGFRLDAEKELPGTGVTALFGRSGSGKTTLLRCIAGLERGAEGFISVHGESWQDSRAKQFVAPHRRSLGFVFQGGGLFPHLSVKANLFYGYRRTPKGERRATPEAIVALLGLGPLMERRPDTLSGGEKQRVAMARALMSSPRLLLMDEPMAGLDGIRKAEILSYLDELRGRFRIPILYVSHDLPEIIRIADRLVFMENGRTGDAGPLREMLVRTDLPIAAQEDAAAMLPVRVVGHDEVFHLTQVCFAGGRLWIPRAEKKAGEPLRLRIHARDVSITLAAPGKTSILNIIAATVTDVVEQSPGRVLVRLDAGGAPLLARITRKSCHELGLRKGLPVYAQIKSVALGVDG